jgi:hypothetical protein
MIHELGKERCKKVKKRCKKVYRKKEKDNGVGKMILEKGKNKTYYIINYKIILV